MPWYTLVYCNDCTGEDPMGCFDGGTETSEPFDTEEEAIADGEKAVKNCPIWGYEVVYKEGP